MDMNLLVSSSGQVRKYKVITILYAYTLTCTHTYVRKYINIYMN